MIECEEPVVLVAHVVHAKVHRRAVGGGGEHHVNHHARDIDLFLPQQLLSLGWLTLVIGFVSGNWLSVLRFFSIEERGDPVLSSELDPCLFRQVVDHFFAGELYVGHRVQDGLVRDNFADA